MRRKHATDRIVPIVLTADEHTELKVAAAQTRVTLAAFIRTKLFGPPSKIASSEVPVVNPAPIAPALTVAIGKALPERRAAPQPGCLPPSDAPSAERAVEAADAFLSDAFGGPPPASRL